MSDRPLKSVDPGTPAKRKTRPGKPKSVTEAFVSGDRIELLFAMGFRLAREMDADEAPMKDLTPSTKRLADVAREIDSLVEPDRESSVRPPDERFDASAI